MFSLFLLLGLALALMMTASLLPMKAVRLQLGVLLAADATTLAPATDANKIALIVAPFTPNENMAIGDLTFAAGNGLDPIAGATGAQEVALDPNGGAQLITLKPGATSGWRWVTSGSFTGPVTIYGYALTDNAAAVLLGVAQLNPTVTVQLAGYQIDIDPVQLVFNQRPIS